MRSQLKCCVIDAGVNSAILFRFEPNGSWSEKILFDEILVKHSEWTTAVGFVDKTFRWFHNNRAQMNDRNYMVRLFCINTVQPVKVKEYLVELGKYICTQINEVENNRIVASVPDNELDYFWVPNGAVWADVIGIDAAYMQLIQKTGFPTGEEDFYQCNKFLIDSYFHTGTYTLDLAHNLGAPLHEVHLDDRP
jgi:hypothetical protein